MQSLRIPYFVKGNVPEFGFEAWLPLDNPKLNAEADDSESGCRVSLHAAHAMGIDPKLRSAQIRTSVKTFSATYERGGKRYRTTWGLDREGQKVGKDNDAKKSSKVNRVKLYFIDDVHVPPLGTYSGQSRRQTKTKLLDQVLISRGLRDEVNPPPMTDKEIEKETCGLERDPNVRVSRRLQRELKKRRNGPRGMIERWW